MNIKTLILLTLLLPLAACSSTPKQPTAGVKAFTVPQPPSTQE